MVWFYTQPCVTYWNRNLVLLSFVLWYRYCCCTWILLIRFVRMMFRREWCEYEEIHVSRVTETCRWPCCGRRRWENCDWLTPWSSVLNIGLYSLCSRRSITRQAIRCVTVKSYKHKLIMKLFFSVIGDSLLLTILTSHFVLYTNHSVGYVCVSERTTTCERNYLWPLYYLIC